MKTNCWLFISNAIVTYERKASKKNINLSNNRHHRNIETNRYYYARIENDHYNLTTRSEKEALKKRKKRTPTVAMTAEQYKAKRGIFLSTPKKTGRHLTEASISVFVFASFLPLSLFVGFGFLKERRHFDLHPKENIEASSIVHVLIFVFLFCVHNTDIQKIHIFAP